ncbi:MAG: DinB family protein [Candidatus Heimdallarchaeota archaeon]
MEKQIEEFRFQLKDGLIGGDTHLYTNEVIQKLPFDIANNRIAPTVSTIWEIFFHMYFWQMLIIALLEDDDSTFKENIKLKSFPKDECNQNEFEDYRNRFLDGLAYVEKIIDNIDLFQPTPNWKNVQKYKILQILLQHNSYHLGQIIFIQKSLVK